MVFGQEKTMQMPAGCKMKQRGKSRGKYGVEGKESTDPVQWPKRDCWPEAVVSRGTCEGKIQNGHSPSSSFRCWPWEMLNCLLPFCAHYNGVPGHNDIGGNVAALCVLETSHPRKSARALAEEVAEGRKEKPVRSQSIPGWWWWKQPVRMSGGLW